MSIEFELQY